MKRIQEIRQKELENLKRLQCQQIGEEYAKSLENFGAAHIAALDASCEEDEIDVQKRDEYDLIAATRGRSAMLQVQRSRDREAEDRLAKRKRKGLKSVSIQADFVTRTQPLRSKSLPEPSTESEEDSSSAKYMSKLNQHKSSTYNPKNFTSNSVDSSNHGESVIDDDTSIEVEESEEEFDQIKNLLKRRCFEFDNQLESHENDPVTISESSSSKIEVEIPHKKIQTYKTTKPHNIPKKPSILKMNKSPKKDKKVNYNFLKTNKKQSNNVKINSPKKQMTKKQFGRNLLLK